MAHRARPLTEVIAESIAEWSTPFVELAVFGTADPDAIADTLERFCAVHLGADPTACLFWAASVGVTTGLILDDDRAVVIKGRQPRVERAQLSSVATLRGGLSRAAFPTPAVIGGPHAFGCGLATIEAYVAAPPPVDGLRPDNRELLAAGLHRLIQLATPLAGGLTLAAPEIAPPPCGALWPTPHSRLFDFGRTAAGAEGIDEIAHIARGRMSNGADEALVVAHLDWRVEHVRIADGAIRAVFDWDSIHHVLETSAVGCAAAHFAANWQDEFRPKVDRSHNPACPLENSAKHLEPSDLGTRDFAGRRYPTPDESDAFVAAYAAARGRPFDDAERRAIGAARTYGIAYAARCGHDPDGQPIPGAAEEMLLRFGERYLVVRS